MDTAAVPQSFPVRLVYAKMSSRVHSIPSRSARSSMRI